jgi:hypothetical protein
MVYAAEADVVAITSINSARVTQTNNQFQFLLTFHPVLSPSK